MGGGGGKECPVRSLHDLCLWHNGNSSKHNCCAIDGRSPQRLYRLALGVQRRRGYVAQGSRAFLGAGEVSAPERCIGPWRRLRVGFGVDGKLLRCALGLSGETRGLFWGPGCVGSSGYVSPGLDKVLLHTTISLLGRRCRCLFECASHTFVSDRWIDERMAVFCCFSWRFLFVSVS